MNAMLNAQYHAGLVNNSDLCKLKTTPLVIPVMLGKTLCDRENSWYLTKKNNSALL